VGDSGLEILHGGEGGDVELGSRTSKHIFAFAFDLLSLNSLSFICAKHLQSFHIIYIACVALHTFIFLYLLYAWIVYVCLTYT